jgi:tRNA-Thr(GGU) m(6)t(6)A37 methyltransferase TsaA
LIANANFAVLVDHWQEAFGVLEKIVYSPIGFVENEFKKSEDPKRIRNATSILAIDEEFLAALEGLERFQNLVVIYHLNRTPGYQEKVHPMGDISIPMRGVLATRSPCRPNPIGITVVEHLGIEKSRIKVTGLDALDGTPILDIKPYMEHFDLPHGLQRERDPNYRPSD